MPARTKKAKRVKRGAGKSGAAPTLHTSAASTSSSASPAFSSPSTAIIIPLLHALPHAALSRLHASLGFTTLMDIRAVSIHMKRRCEEAALQWMAEHLTAAAQQMREAERREKEAAATAEEKDEEIEEKELASIDDIIIASASVVKGEVGGGTSSAQLPSSFRLSDAVWFRQQLSRWRFGSAGQDTSTCRIGPADAWRAYGLPLRSEMDYTWHHGVTSFLVMEVVHRMFRQYRHADHFIVTLSKGEEERNRGSGSARVSRKAQAKLTALQEAAERAREKWLQSSTDQHFLVHLPQAVLVYNVLSLIEFDSLMNMRRLSRAVQPIIDKAACGWMNRTFPAGLATITRLQQEEKEKEAQKKTSTDKKVRGKRKRGEQKADLPDGDSLSTPSSSTPSTSSSSSATSNSSSTSVSYTIADAKFVSRTLDWGRRLDWNQKRDARRPRDSPFVAVVCKSQVLPYLPITDTAWTERFGKSKKTSRYGTGASRYPVQQLLDLLFTTHGHASSITQRQQQRTAKAQQMKQARETNAAMKVQLRVEKVEAAMNDADVKYSWSNRGWLLYAGRVPLSWNGVQWVVPRATYREEQYEEWKYGQVTEEEIIEEAKLHGVTLKLGIICEQRCGYGVCGDVLSPTAFRASGW